jgi:hypothetical protein
VTLVALDSTGQRLWEKKQSPGEGRLTTDWWQSGTTYADRYQLPVELLGRVGFIEVGVRPFPEAPWWPTASGADVVRMPIPP